MTEKFIQALKSKNIVKVREYLEEKLLEKVDTLVSELKESYSIEQLEEGKDVESKVKSSAVQYAKRMKKEGKNLDKIKDGLKIHYPSVDTNYVFDKLEEAFKGDQHKLDHDKDGEIEGSDLAKLRNKKENLEELSKKTLGSYINKAAANKGAQHHHWAIHDRDGNTKKRDESRNKMNKRAVGIDKAVNKLSEEETLQELSKKTLGSYVKKAAVDKDNINTNKANADNSLKNLYDNPDKWGMNYSSNKDNRDALHKKIDKLGHKNFNRSKGINKAVDKLSKD
jgi:hypothetical protein